VPRSEDAFGSTLVQSPSTSAPDASSRAVNVPSSGMSALRLPAGALWCRVMDWKLFTSTFAAIFLAEIGDKTQLATLSLAAGGSSRWTVFAGAALALVATSAVAVLAGEALSRAIPPIWLRRGAGALFIVLGLAFLLGSAEGNVGPSSPPGGGTVPPGTS
jgi:Ca2+/H+ antiporter, TMEM165/GDT1 family